MEKVIQNEFLNEKVYFYRSASGLPVYFFEKKGHEKTFAVFATNFGSVDDHYKRDGEFQKLPDGIAHFLEHKLFEDKEGLGALEKLAAMGVQADAYTGFSKTAYLFSCTDRFEEALSILLKFVREPYFTDENTEKEQGIIAQEIKMFEDDPSWRVMFNLLEALYERHPAKIDIAGTVETIGTITKEKLYDCYNYYYDLSNMVLCIAGDQDFEAIKKIVDASLSERAGTAPERKEAKEPDSVARRETRQELHVAMPLFYLGFKENDRQFTGREYTRRAAATSVLLDAMFGKNSDFYERLYTQGLLNRSFDFEYMDERNFAVTMLGGESKNPELVRDEIFSEIEKWKKNFDEEAFNRSKKVIYGENLTGFNSVERIANGFILWYFKGAGIFDSVEVFSEITPEYAKQRLFSHFVEAFSALSVIYPKKNS